MGNRTRAGEDHSVSQSAEEALSQGGTFVVYVTLVETRHVELVLDA